MHTAKRAPQIPCDMLGWPTCSENGAHPSRAQPAISDMACLTRTHTEATCAHKHKHPPNKQMAPLSSTRSVRRLKWRSEPDRSLIAASRAMRGAAPRPPRAARGEAVGACVAPHGRRLSRDHHTVLKFLTMHTCAYESLPTELQTEPSLFLRALLSSAEPMSTTSTSRDSTNSLICSLIDCFLSTTLSVASFTCPKLTSFSHSARYNRLTISAWSTLRSVTAKSVFSMWIRWSESTLRAKSSAVSNAIRERLEASTHTA
mmetsp:Transcript_10921/g.27196  ORF Transcript_10921/g.27196 Transcript_10921/m.27196 type:complete len:259 (+) Transcript_10921:323-1099(+)